jgi:hypothetical protein
MVRVRVRVRVRVMIATSYTRVLMESYMRLIQGSFVFMDLPKHGMLIKLLTK